ncbi:MAG: PIN domain-containing protein [Trueperaceae bacterium]|nr:PIN domain-containing protein [Trueperaceae bacterium]
MTRLLDANVLIAALVVEHVHHEAAERAVASGEAPFATCPITELALVRFLVREGASAASAAEVLAAIARHPRHRTWPADLPAGDVRWGTVQGHRQVTDAYLAALARAHGGRLLTLDRGLAAAHPDVAELIDAAGR